jgi:hypothetical protein
MPQLTIEKPSTKNEGRRSTTRPEAATAELLGITDKKRPIQGKDVWDFVRKHAGNQEHNVEIVPLPNVAMDAPSPLPFTKMDREGRRSKIMWAVVNGVGDTKDRRLSSFLREALQHGGSKVRCADLVAALNGGYSESSKSWGTPFVKLRVVKTPTE